MRLPDSLHFVDQMSTIEGICYLFSPALRSGFSIHIPACFSYPSGERTSQSPLFHTVSDFSKASPQLQEDAPIDPFRIGTVYADDRGYSGH